MSPTMAMEHEQHQEHGFGYHDGSSPWMNAHSGFGSQHQSPIHEHEGFAFHPVPMESIYTSSMQPPGSSYQSLQPLVTPQWPSMLTSQSSYSQPIFSSPPISSAPVSTPLITGRTSSTPRKTLTDADRRRMCLYAEEHPSTKQTEIGAMFGVERSTVSKVLRNKEKYLYQDEGNRSPARKPKGKFPDVEKALAIWARKHQKQGLPISDALIKEQLHHFSLTVGNQDQHLKLANSTSWLEKFKEKNNLMGAKSRKSSIAGESEASNPASGTQTPSTSPTSPPDTKEPSPATTDMDAVKRESPDLIQHSDFFSNHKPYHSLSNASLSSAFHDGIFSPVPTSPPSPFFASSDKASSYISRGSQLPSRVSSVSASSTGLSAQRPRSQTFPMLGIEPGSFVSPPSSEPLTPKLTGQAVIDNDMNGNHVMASIEEMHEGLQVRTSNTTQPPPPPPIIPSPQMHAHPHSSPITPSSAASLHMNGVSPSFEDTKRCLEVVMTFFQNQKGSLESQEWMMMGTLMEKLKLHHHQHLPVAFVGEMPGGMHRIPSVDFKHAGFISNE